MSRKKYQNIATILGLGKRLRDIRGPESQDSFGRRYFGLGKSTISKFEADIMIPNSETLGKYAALGKTTKEWLLKGEGCQSAQGTTVTTGPGIIFRRGAPERLGIFCPTPKTWPQKSTTIAKIKRRIKNHDHQERARSPG